MAEVIDFKTRRATPVDPAPEQADSPKRPFAISDRYKKPRYKKPRHKKPRQVPAHPDLIRETAMHAYYDQDGVQHGKGLSTFTWVRPPCFGVFMLLAIEPTPVAVASSPIRE